MIHIQNDQSLFLITIIFDQQNSHNVSIPQENLDKAVETVCNADSISIGLLTPVERQILSNMKTRKYSTQTWNEHPLHPQVADCRTIDWLVFIFIVACTRSCKVIILGFSSSIYLIFPSGAILMFPIKARRIPIAMLSIMVASCILGTGHYVLLLIEVYYILIYARFEHFLIIFLALDNGIPITSPTYYGYRASDEELAAIFKSDTKESAPMLKERIRVMREAGKILCEVHCFFRHISLDHVYNMLKFRNTMDPLSIVLLRPNVPQPNFWILL